MTSYIPITKILIKKLSTTETTILENISLNIKIFLYLAPIIILIIVIIAPELKTAIPTFLMKSLKNNNSII